MKKILFYALLVVMLMPLIAFAQTTNEVKYHKYKDFAHDASDIKWAAGQSMRAYIDSLGLSTLPAWMDSVEVAINLIGIDLAALTITVGSNEVALLDVISDLSALTITVGSNEVALLDVISDLSAHITDLANPHQVTAAQVTTNAFTGLLTGALNVQSALEIVDAFVFSASATTVDASGFDGNLDTTDVDLQKVAQKLDDLTLPAAGNAIEDVGTFISTNLFEFDDDYDTSAVAIYRNGVLQPRRLFTTVDVSSKTRVLFSSAVDDSDEIILISNK